VPATVRSSPPTLGCAKQGAGRTHRGCWALQAAELDLTMVLDLGQSERCLVGRGCIIATSPAPSSMQRHAAGLTGGMC